MYSTPPSLVPVSEAEKVASKMFVLQERKAQYEQLMVDHGERIKKIKTPEEQYQEETEMILTSTSKTQSVKLQYFEEMPGEKETTRMVSGHATRKRMDGFAST